LLPYARLVNLKHIKAFGIKLETYEALKSSKFFMSQIASCSNYRIKKRERLAD